MVRIFWWNETNMNKITEYTKNDVTYIPKITEYVLGFLFNTKRNHVLLIKKNRPEWQAGKLNGIGGHIEENESPIQAMIREFKEETGLQFGEWAPVINLIGSDWKCIVFCGFSDVIWDAETKTDEELIRVSVRGLHSNCLTNLNWLIPMCLDKEVIEGVYKLGVVIL